MQLMIQASSILVCTKPVDFRKAIDGLLDIVLSVLNSARRGPFQPQHKGPTWSAA
jgi:hypothetical protein